MFFSTFLSRIIIRYKSEITYLNANELSRLSSDSVDFESTLEKIEEIEKNIFEMSHEEEHTRIEFNVVRIIMSVIIIKDIDDFLNRVVKKLKIDDVFKKIYAHL
jgi:RNA processing factor Prp31